MNYTFDAFPRFLTFIKESNDHYDVQTSQPINQVETFLNAASIAC